MAHRAATASGVLDTFARHSPAAHCHLKFQLTSARDSRTEKQKPETISDVYNCEVDNSRGPRHFARSALQTARHFLGSLFFLRKPLSLHVLRAELHVYEHATLNCKVRVEPSVRFLRLVDPRLNSLNLNYEKETRGFRARRVIR